MPRYKGVFVPHECCTVASGDCFTEGRCLRQCKAAERKDQAARIRELDRRVLELEKIVYAQRYNSSSTPK